MDSASVANWLWCPPWPYRALRVCSLSISACCLASVRFRVSANSLLALSRVCTGPCCDHCSRCRDIGMHNDDWFAAGGCAPPGPVPVYSCRDPAILCATCGY